MALLSIFYITTSFNEIRKVHRMRSFKVSNSDDNLKISNEDDVNIDLESLAQESAVEAALVKPEDKYPSSNRNFESITAPRQAQWFPLLLSPSYLDGSFAGDVGFDPLGLASNKPGLIYWMRDAEIKHARLAMLAAIGWPTSELYHEEFADLIGLPSILAPEDKAPSILNGGLMNEWVEAALALVLVIGAALEYSYMKKVGMGHWEDTRPNYKPGDFGFDPLRLHSFRTAFMLDRIAENLTREQKIKQGKFDMELAEIKNGRLAMLGITGMAIQEFIFGTSVVDQTPFFFGDRFS